jgi:hypothetical protein
MRDCDCCRGTGALFICAPLAGRLVSRLGERPLIGFGLLMQAIGMAWLGRVATPDMVLRSSLCSCAGSRWRFNGHARGAGGDAQHVAFPRRGFRYHTERQRVRGNRRLRVASGHQSCSLMHLPVRLPRPGCFRSPGALAGLLVPRRAASL